MFSLKVLNKLSLAEDVEAEVMPTLPNHKAWVLIRPQVDPERVEWDKVSRRWLRIYVDEDILTGFKVNRIEIAVKQLEDYFSHRVDIDIQPTINERFYVTSEEELVALVSRWLSDFSVFQRHANVPLIMAFDL